jgi:monoamine oxidase
MAPPKRRTVRRRAPTRPIRDQRAGRVKLGRTLYFAGEATDAEEMGTVAGALASGRRAARRILRSL